MNRSISYNKSLMSRLRDPQVAAAYLDAILEEGDEKLFLKALGKVAEARGGMSRLAKRTKQSRVGLYKIFTEHGNPRFETIEKILKAFDLRLSIEPQKGMVKGSH